MSPDRPASHDDAWPLSSSLIVSFAVAATIGLADVVYVLSVAGGDIGGRLLAVLPIYFIAAFSAAQLVFWLLRAGLRPVLGLGLLEEREHRRPGVAPRTGQPVRPGGASRGLVLVAGRDLNRRPARPNRPDDLRVDTESNPRAGHAGHPRRSESLLRASPSRS